MCELQDILYVKNIVIVLFGRVICDYKRYLKLLSLLSELELG